MSRVTESYHTYDRVMSHMNGAFQVGMSYVTHKLELYHR